MTTSPVHPIRAHRPVLFCVLDGWGLNPARENNAIAMAHTPNFNRLWDHCPHTSLRADGLAVGLPEGQFGNSEVGHMNIGAGRVVMQDLPRITMAINKGEMEVNPTLVAFADKLAQSGGTAHVMGLVSNGGVHAHQDQMAAVITILRRMNVPVIVHAFTDGRDTPPTSARDLVEQFIHAIPADVSIGTVSGRYYAMDRDNRWERVSRAFNAIVHADGIAAPSALHAIESAYAETEHDEFIQPRVMETYTGMKPEDGIFMVNFRADRVREILRALVLPQFDAFDRGTYTPPKITLGMVEYADDLNPYMPMAFASQNMEGLLGEVVSAAGLTQIRAAETEKYPHVTFFFNGGREAPYEGEKRLLVASPKVATYDLKPEMSAVELTDQLIAMIESDPVDLIILNYANADMVGHTGDIKAAIKAVETVDTCVARLCEAISQKDGVIVITADHGNADQMVDPETGGIYTAHTKFPVPFIIAGADDVTTLRTDGKLGDIAPTLLHLLGLHKPGAMSGDTLIKG